MLFLSEWRERGGSESEDASGARNTASQDRAAHLARISHSAKKRTAFLSHKLLFNDNFSQSKKAVRCLQSVASKRSISSPWVRGK